MRSVSPKSVLVLVLASLVLTSCIAVGLRDLSDLGITRIECSSDDGRAHCVCYEKCVATANDCSCAD